MIYTAWNNAIQYTMYMKVHVYSTPVVEWNKKRKEKKRKERQSILTHPSVPTIQEYINIYRGDTWMPSLENWDGGLIHVS